jgi:hypothetical protein
MNKIGVFVGLALSLCLLASPAAAAEKVKGTVKAIDEKARTIKFSAEGSSKEDTLAVDNAVDLKGVKSNMKAQVTVDGGVVKEIRPEGKRSAPGY